MYFNTEPVDYSSDEGGDLACERTTGMISKRESLFFTSAGDGFGKSPNLNDRPG